MFVDLNDKPCLIAGGGNIAYRKALTLLDFHAKLEVVAPELCGELMALSGSIRLHLRKVTEEDCLNKMLVVAAMDDHAKNHRIAEFCRKSGIPVNAVDQKEDCTFIFPSYVKEGDVVAAFSSAGKSPALTQYLKAEEKTILTEEIGKLNDCLGAWRARVWERFPEEEKRKLAYRRILERGLKDGSVPKDDTIRDILKDLAIEEGINHGEKNGENETT